MLKNTVHQDLSFTTQIRQGMPPAAALAITDALCWVLAAFAVVVIRYNYQLDGTYWSWFACYLLAAVALQVLLGITTKLYVGIAKVGSFIEVSRLAITTALVGSFTGVIYLLLVNGYAQALALMAPIISLVLMLATRLIFRAIQTSCLQQNYRDPQRRKVLLYGAGSTGQQLGNLIMADPKATYQVVGIIDDDPRKRHWRFAFGQVIGSRNVLVQQAKQRDAEAVIVANSKATPEYLKELSQFLADSELDLLVLPPVSEIISTGLSLGSIREFDVNDLLGRTPISTEVEKIAHYLHDKVVLITGAGGSIGSEIARQVNAFGPRQLLCLDRDESALHAVQLSLYNNGLLDTPDMVLCDIRDQEAVQRIFEQRRPDVVFHAAALKHLPLLEQYPEEGWKTNVLGTLNVLRAAANTGVARLINISTDKAADPISVLGKTKRWAEELTAWHATELGKHYLSVRFGNVLGSRGSVLHTFRYQIENGGPVTVVDPNVTRYFMTIPEACQLVLQACAIGDPGQVMVLDMGEPVRILDVAQRLIKTSGKNIEINFTGLRDGEKLHEVLFSQVENSVPSSHSLISCVKVAPRDPALLDADQVLSQLTKRPDVLLETR